jgi:site-specific DNA-methyltransferase (adenine-specific)
MQTMHDNSIDAIVTDPPYGLGFMGKKWDSGLPMQEIWQEALRIAKPGSHLLAFGGTRTFHRLACSIEDAGWEVRDCVSWLYGSGFPKSHNFGKQLGEDWQGYGSALKPAWEPIIVAMKPLDGTFAQNAEKWGVAGINIDECRIGTIRRVPASLSQKKGTNCLGSFGPDDPSKKFDTNMGRWPANLILDEEAAEMLDQQSGQSKSKKNMTDSWGSSKVHEGYQRAAHKNYVKTLKGHNDSGGASRFFYVAKASSSERNQGLEELPEITGKRTLGGGEMLTGSGNKRSICMKNHHPTVKPLALMEYLIKLVMPPKGGILLDPFAGSGTTIVAATRLGYEAIGIEKEAEYCQIARARVDANRNLFSLKVKEA